MSDCFLQIRPQGADAPIVPSFMSIDVDGRVIRVDSFSKIVAPGSRCGWITGPKEIVTRIMNRSEASTVSGLGWILVVWKALIHHSNAPLA
jgi:aromatic amino acid aminotransferase I